MPDKFDPKYIVIIQYDNLPPEYCPFYEDEYDEACQLYWERKQNWSTVYFCNVEYPVEPSTPLKVYPNPQI